MLMQEIPMVVSQRTPQIALLMGRMAFRAKRSKRQGEFVTRKPSLIIALFVTSALSAQTAQQSDLGGRVLHRWTP